MGTPDALVLDLLEWVARQPRLYVDVIDAWRTSCPRLTIWEDAVDCGFVERTMIEGRRYVVITSAGERVLAASRAVTSKAFRRSSFTDC